MVEESLHVACVEQPEGLFARGSIMRGIIADPKSPIAYGYDEKLAVSGTQ